MSFRSATITWLKDNRTSARMAVALRIVSMGIGSVLSLLWMRLLLHAMGDPLLGLFQNFQAVTRLGGLGDLGITGALALTVGTMLGRKEDAGLRTLLSSARMLFLLVAGALFILFFGLSPWLPRWLGFESVAGSGSMTGLFIYGAGSLFMVILGGYFASLNYANGTVTWPILPSVLIIQVIAPFIHWRLALLHMPLWVQLLPYLGCSILMALLNWLMLRWSHPWLGDLTPMKCNFREWKALAGASGWVYMVSVATAIYFVTDRLVIGAVIGMDLVPKYLFNYKACDLAGTLIVTGAFVSFPKITQWMASSDEKDRQRLLVELNRLSTFEVVLACGAALGYIALNNLFISIWLDKAHQAPLSWQIAFACNLAVTVGGNAGIQSAMRAGDKGLKMSGLIIGGAGLLNLGLSIVSAKLGSIAGVAVATVIAQSVSSISLGTITCRYLKLSVSRWIWRCWALPLGITLAAAELKKLFSGDSLGQLGILSGCYALMFLLVCWLAGLNLKLLKHELAHVQAMFFRR